MTAKSVKSNKSGELELLRFVMALIILFFHMNKHMLGKVPFPGSKWGFFLQGSMGVEFFFVCSGFLMAASAAREYRVNPAPDGRMLGQSTSSFMYRKIMAFLPYHVISFILAWAVSLAVDWHGVRHAIEFTVRSIPSFFLIHMSGWKMANPHFVEWYLSVMVLSMLILFPLIRKYYPVFTRVIAPAVGILLLGYLFHKYHRLGNVKVWDGFVFKAMLRGIAELCLGALTYEIVVILKEKIKTEKIKILNSVIFIGGTLLFIAFVCRQTKPDYQFFLVPLSMVLVAVCFMGTCFSNALNNRVVMFLGRFSLPIYLAQVVGVEIADSKLLPKSMGAWPRIAVGIAIALVTAVVVLWAGNLLKRLLDRLKKGTPEPTGS